MRRILDMLDMKRARDVVDTIGKEDPESIKQAYEDLSKIDPKGTAVFSVDNKEERIPFQVLRSYLKDNNPSLKGQRSVSDMSSAMRGAAIGSSEAYSYDKDSMQDESEDGYYWDDPNRGYEHMNPEAVKAKVLSKRK